MISSTSLHSYLLTSSLSMTKWWSGCDPDRPDPSPPMKAGLAVVRGHDDQAEPAALTGGTCDRMRRWPEDFFAHPGGN